MLIQKLVAINSAQQRSMIYELGLTLYVYSILGTILLQKFPVNVIHSKHFSISDWLKSCDKFFVIILVLGPVYKERR